MKWEIVGYDSTTEIYRGEVSGRYGVRRVSEILRRLASRHLTPAEIVDASTAADGRLLHVHHDWKAGHLMCGSGTWYAARRRQ